MSLLPPRVRRMKLQHPVFHGTMPALAHVANLNAAVGPVPVTAYDPGRKPH